MAGSDVSAVKAPRWASSATASAACSAGVPLRTLAARSWCIRRVRPTVVGLPSWPQGPSPNAAAVVTRIRSEGTSARLGGGTLHGSQRRSATESRAGSETSTSSVPSSCSRVSDRSSPVMPMTRTPVAKGKPVSWAISGPTWPVSPSSEFRPTRTRSKGPSWRKAAASARAVARVSEPPKAGSHRCTPRSAPQATASRRTSSAAGGPSVKTVQEPPLSRAHSTPLETARRQ